MMIETLLHRGWPRPARASERFGPAKAGPYKFVLLYLLVLSCVANPAGASSRSIPPPTQATAALKAVSFAPIPQPAYIEVKLRDDAPENVQLAWEMHNALQQRGLLAKAGPTLRLTLEVDSAAMIGEVATQKIKGKQPPPERAKLMGLLRATLADAKSGARLWEAEALYETIWGDLAGGALKLVPKLVETLGRSVDEKAIILR